VNLDGAVDINGDALPLTRIEDKARNVIPQRSNLLITAGFALPGFDGIMRGFRRYKPRVDPATVSGFTFVADGTPLWIASVPPDPGRRNLYTALPDGSMIAFTAANAGALAPLMNLAVADATAVIASRAMPLGAIIDSTPALMNAPSPTRRPTSRSGVRACQRVPPQHDLVGTNRGVLRASTPASASKSGLHPAQPAAEVENASRRSAGRDVRVLRGRAGEDRRRQV
jgi:hypothetical protein